MLRRLAAAGVALGLVLTPGVAHADRISDQEQWQLDAVNAARAWTITKGKGVTVGLVDTGTDPGHPDLAGSVTVGPDFIKNEMPHAARVHGTMMASLIVAHGHGSGDGVTGIAPEAKLVAVRSIADAEEPGYKAYLRHESNGALAHGIRYVADHGAKVINLSLGGPGMGYVDRDAVGYAISKGIVVVASAGNDGASTNPKKTDKDGFNRLNFPAGFPGVISVAAVDRNRRRASFSDRNASVTVAAPGKDMVAAGPGNSYYTGDGTSPAAAIVSGVAALIKAKYPEMAPALVAQAITASARNRPAAGYDDSVGFGEVDAAGALVEAGRLAGYKVAVSVPEQRYGKGGGKPVAIIRHPPGMVFLGGWVGVASLFGLVGAVATALLLARRIRWSGRTR